jgi:hypothetical protein
MLCPVRWCAKGGWLVVMAAATPLTEAEKDRLIDTDGFPDWDYMPGEDGEPFEYKATDWGWFDGRLVAVDYSTPAFDGPGEKPAPLQQTSYSMLRIMRIALPKEHLQKLTAGERSLFLLLGYASNQINTLWKLVIVATNDRIKDPVEEKVSAAQTQIFVRLLIGTMREALKLIEKRFLGSKIGKEYVPILNPQTKEALDRLKKRFGAPDKFVVIRDNFAFHHPSLEDMEAAFQLAVKADGDDTDWCIYLNNALLNTFFFASDFVLVHGMANAMGETDVNEAHRKLLGDIAPIANDLSTFAFGFAEAIFIKYFGELNAALVAEIKDAANIEELRLPWFLETTTMLATGEA